MTLIRQKLDYIKRSSKFFIITCNKYIGCKDIPKDIRLQVDALMQDFSYTAFDLF